MPITFTFIAIISVVFGALFFVVDFYERKHPKLNISLIAGISISYFFLVLLPEIAENIPVFPFELTIFEYLFVLIGFIFVHTSEKLILQKVESKSQRRMRKLIEKEKIVEDVEENIENILTRELEKEDFDNDVLRDIAQTIADLHKQGLEFTEEINRYKAKIQTHINEDLGNLRFFTNFSYHLLVGIIVVGLLAFDIISGIDIDENITRKYILAFSNFIGVLIGLILDLVAFEYTEMFYVLFSFISGVILYTVVREIIPEKEKGQPIYFLLGFTGFTVLIFTINIFTSII